MSEYQYPTMDDVREDRARLRAALINMVNCYVRLVNSGDAGNWDPETDAAVMDARAALNATPFQGD